MRHACEACRLRKIKCVWKDDNGTSCKFCVSIGLNCRTTVRRRQRTHGDPKSSSSSVLTASNAGTRAAPYPPRSGPSPATRPSGYNSPYEDNASSNPNNEAYTPSIQATNACLLGVPGLTRHALDTCIDTYFETVGLVFRVTTPRSVFLRRVQARLCYSAGTKLPADLADVANDPASDIYILAVACRGALFSRYSSLTTGLYSRCVDLVKNPRTLQCNPLDAIEAVSLLSELSVRSRHAEQEDKTTSPTEIDPLGKGSVVDLLFYHGINIPPTPSDPQYGRRLALFWTIWTHDAIRSASASTCYRISDADIGWSMGASPSTYPIFTLAQITRQICSKLLSPRAKSLGMKNDDVQNILSDLACFCEQVSISIGTLTTMLGGDESQQRVHPVPMHGQRPLTALEVLFILSTHGWLYLVTWVAVQDERERRPDQLSHSTLDDVDVAAMSACEDVAHLAQLSTTHNLHVRGPKSIRNHMAAFTLFLVRSFARLTSPTVRQSSDYFALAETLNRAVRAAIFYPDSQLLANTLRMTIHHASGIVAEDAARVAERGLEGLPTPGPSLTPGSHSAETSIIVPPSASSSEAPRDAGLYALATPSPTMRVSPCLSGDEQGSSLTPLSQPGARTIAASQDDVIPLEIGPVTIEALLATAPNTQESCRNTESTADMAASQPMSEVDPSLELDWDALMGTLHECGIDLPGLL